MHRKTLATGILLLFLIGTVSPVAFGINIEDSEETTYVDDISYVYSIPETIGRKNSDNPRINQQCHSLNELTYYLKEQPSNSLGGPIDSAWPMASHDNHHTGLSPYNTASNPGVEIWRYKAEGAVDTGIVLDADGNLYFGDFHGDLISLYPDGSLRWKYSTGNIITMSTPCISEDGTIYFGAYDNRLHAVNPDGSLKWKTNVGGDVGGAPAIAGDGTIYVGQHNFDMVAVYPNGTIKWKYTTGDRVVSDPAIADDGTIIFGSADNNVYALYPNGTLKWNYLTNSDVKGGASIDEDGIIYIASWGDYLHAIYPNGTMKWKTLIDEGSETTPCFGPDGTIYVSYKKLWAINPGDGSIKWTYDYIENDETSFLSNPAISADGIIYIGTEIDEVKGGQIYAINSDGTLRWRKLIADENTASSPSIAEDGTVYIGSWWVNGGHLHAFNEWIGSNNPPETPTLGPPKAPFWLTYFLSIKTIDPESHPSSYIVDWGDGEIEEILAIASNTSYSVPHHYSQVPSIKKIKVKAIDALGAESEWAELNLWLLKDTLYDNFQWFFEQFPIFSRLMKLIMERS